MGLEPSSLGKNMLSKMVSSRENIVRTTFFFYCVQVNEQYPDVVERIIWTKQFFFQNTMLRGGTGGFRVPTRCEGRPIPI